jgi:competence protein ComEA
MTKISWAEAWILGLTLLFVAATTGWFLHQNTNRELVRIEVSRAAAPAGAALTAEDTNPAPGLLEGERININTAPAGDLERLPGIGPARARDIVAYRETMGPFAATESIMEVSGIGEKTYERIANYITVSEGGDGYAADSGGG